VWLNWISNKVRTGETMNAISEGTHVLTVTNITARPFTLHTQKIISACNGLNNVQNK
jgi:hypothetical protein